MFINDDGDDDENDDELEYLFCELIEWMSVWESRNINISPLTLIHSHKFFLIFELIIKNILSIRINYFSKSIDWFINHLIEMKNDFDGDTINRLVIGWLSEWVRLVAWNVEWIGVGMWKSGEKRVVVGFW